MGLFVPDAAAAAPMCALAGTPRTAAHCVQWALHVAWGARVPGAPFDAGDTDHVRWLGDAARARAVAHGIPFEVGTRALHGLVRTSVPALASANAVIAAACSIEAVRLVALQVPLRGVHYAIQVQDQVSTETVLLARDAGCAVCGIREHRVPCAASSTLRALLARCAALAGV